MSRTPASIGVATLCFGTWLAAQSPTGETATPAAALADTGGRGLTVVHGIKVGSITLNERPTGCTVILVDGEGVPAGSAYGLDPAQGTVRLEERQIGWKVGSAVVPIVPAAILMNLGLGGKPQIGPTADCGHKAAQASSSASVAEGNVGAGAGAAVGKMGVPSAKELGTVPSRIG